MQIGSAAASVQVIALHHAMDVHSLTRRSVPALRLNDLGRVRLRFDRPLVVAPYAHSRELGALILVDRLTNATAAMGTVVAEADMPAVTG